MELMRLATDKAHRDKMQIICDRVTGHGSTSQRLKDQIIKQMTNQVKRQIVNFHC